MSFSQQTKEELASVYGSSRQAVDAQISAMLIFGKAFSQSGQILQTEHRSVADCLIDLLTDTVSPIMTLIHAPNPRRGGGEQYFLNIENATEQAQIKSIYLSSPDLEYHANQDDDIYSALLRGAFLVCGSISDPEKDYHLEFVVPNRELAAKLAVILSEKDIPIKYMTRKNQFVLYLKESESIEDLLTFMGATKTSLSLMSVKVLKDVRNKVNRMTNCETANLEKTAVASVNQLKDIQRIEETIGLEELPAPLAEAAKFRRQFPELSLQELSEKIGTVTRSGLYHRFRRLHTIAQKEQKKK